MAHFILVEAVPSMTLGFYPFSTFTVCHVKRQQIIDYLFRIWMETQKQTFYNDWLWCSTLLSGINYVKLALWIVFQSVVFSWLTFSSHASCIRYKVAFANRFEGKEHRLPTKFRNIRRFKMTVKYASTFNGEFYLLDLNFEPVQYLSTLCGLFSNSTQFYLESNVKQPAYKVPVHGVKISHKRVKTVKNIKP